MSGHHSFSKLRDQVLSRPGGAAAMAKARVETMEEIRLYGLRHAEAMRQIEETGRLVIMPDAIADLEQFEDGGLDAVVVGSRLEGGSQTPIVIWAAGTASIGNKVDERVVKRCMRLLPLIIAVPALALAACGGTVDTGDSAVATARLEVTAFAGPVCPVETDPPSPECAPRPVDAATIVVTDATGNEIARGTTGFDGAVGFEVTPGELAVIPQPVEGLLGTAAMISVTLSAGQTLQVTVDYDTGIR